MSAKLLPIDMDYVRDVLLRLLRTPSPTGRTDEVMHLIGEELEAIGVGFYLTRLGSLVAELKGAQERPDRAVVVHSDVIGCVVKRVRDNGRLQLSPVGTFSPRFAEGARVRIFTDDSDTAYTGTVLPLLASGHTFGDAVDDQPTSWAHVEVRIDEFVETPEETFALGIRAGDFVALDAAPVITRAGFVNARHLDDKAGLAAALGAFKCLVDHQVALPVTAHLLVTIAEEVGQGASHGLDADVAEMVSVDNAVVAPGQYSRETGVNVAMKDEIGPFDYHLTRKLLRLCRDVGIPAQRDVFNFYRSDISSALGAGAETRAALIGCGVDASHGWERTHLDGIRNVAELLVAYLQTPLMFAWDERPRGALEDFPEQDAESDLGGY
ncbi:MAG: osmoprotectant NAGGN system M42 family peptidase [Egibacteraceae bacterium]